MCDFPLWLIFPVQEKLLPEKNAKILDFPAEHGIMKLTIEGGMVPMNCKIAFFDLKGALAPEDKPLMLQPVLFCPVLTWVAQELMCCGVQRYFIVCRNAWQQEAREALQGFDAEFFDDASSALSAVEDAVLVVPGPVVPVYGPESRNIYAADAAVLRSRLREGAPLTDCPAESVGIRALWQSHALAPAFRQVADAAELNAAMPAARELLLRRMAANGVTVVDPANTYVDPRCSVAPGVTLLPGTILRGHTAIAAGCEIGPNSMVRDCTVGEGTTVNASQINESVIGSHTTVGPFTYVRPGCTIGDRCRVGDFVEVKNSVIGHGTKISHLTYVGDSDVGQRVNFGCGTVTTNYDGHKKFRCTIGDDVFLGCNTNLIAPVTVGDRAYTAAGSTVTDDVPDGALAIARARQTNKEGWADRLRALWKKEK